MSNENFQGFAVKSHEDWQTFHRHDFKPKKWEETDIDIKIHACGVCGSDVHTITGGWAKANLPLVVGHEVIGEVVKVGSKVKEFKVGDRAGVGAQIWSCGECTQCKNGNECYCPKQVDTYNAPFPTGEISQGGYSNMIRSNELFTFKIPEKLETKIAAPMLCAGITVFSPLKRNFPGKGEKVAIIGIGGLGHLAIQFAKALGAEVYAISHTQDKEKDAKELGADHFIWTGKEKWAEPYQLTFKMVLNTADMTHKFELSEFLGICTVHGKFVNVGLPDEDLKLNIMNDMMANGVFFGASHLGNKSEVEEMLQLAADKGVRTWIEVLQMSEENCSKAVQKVKVNDVRYRCVLTGFEKAFPETWK